MSELTIQEHPAVSNPRLVLGLTGWMDGGSVSTGTVSYLRDKLGATKFAEIEPLDFYIFHFPVSTVPVSVQSAGGRLAITQVDPMQFAAVFRPHTRIEDGSIQEFTCPRNEFLCSERSDLILFSGEEPHVRWGAYCDCLFDLAEECGVKEFYFVGSVAGPVPHTREPRIRASVPRQDLKERLGAAGVEFTNYEGPASLVTLLAHQSVDRGIEMRSLVVEIPHYPFLEMPTYPKSILKATSALNTLLGLDLDLSDLRESSAKVDEKLDAVMEDSDEFRELVAKLERAYDYEESAAEEERLRRLIEMIDLGDDEGHS
ncbi:MAG: PAC2 family protein [Armatimonadota bacterium]